MSDTELLLLTLGAPFALSLAGALFKFIEGLLPKDKQFEIESAISSVVKAVEQSMPGASNEEKKANAIKLANAVLAELHLPINPQMIDVLIEESVFHLPDTNSQAPIPVEQGA